ncbi:Zinc knuckle CX2CX4HX4C [Parasponia andersonii]|uniref:Zinc knuckle CX2CX4HX4C n=1 Tax=Parasponia andersonii TaxID=3476 RepID=A0A2P5BNI7_PARAD|nr:Zinc knuckle CX2CX4HX4C [Parasponia andersonii]
MGLLGSSILSDLARGVGVSIRFDEMTLKGEFGHFTRILIDIDLSQPLSDSLMVEVGSNYLFVPLEYECLPDFCTSCKAIGHLASAYRRGQSLAVSKDSEPKVKRGRSRSRRRVYRLVTKSPKVPDVPVKNAFSALKKGLVTNEHIDEGNSRGKKKLWADEVALIDPVAITEPAVNSAHAIQLSSVAATTDVLNIDEQALIRRANLSSENIAPAINQIGSSSVEESKSDSLNTSDLSPTKVFTSHNEGWQEVQSRKKKKAPPAQFSRPVTRSTKSNSQ